MFTHSRWFVYVVKDAKPPLSSVWRPMGELKRKDLSHELVPKRRLGNFPSNGVEANQRLLVDD